MKMHSYSGGLTEYELFKESLQQKYGSPLEERMAMDRKSGSAQWKDGDSNSIKLSFGSKSLLWPGLTISYAGSFNLSCSIDGREKDIGIKEGDTYYRSRY